ncbi:CLUMA_CG010196, isoform A [Clunio marinus]|uniref:CLUMA_CG010196, isoform A n=1 Tax=Clunio marinus TaxID=568069 RepID=A0A1J1I8R0_9DIPT|nr:CLUMA_CG010196, isoform A [Clunio marinus]
MRWSSSSGFALTQLSMYFGFMKPSLFSVILFMMHYYQTYVVVGTMMLMKSFEILIVTLLDDLRFDLQTILKDKNVIDWNILITKLVNYQNIFKVSNEFNDVFGLQLTLVTVSVIVNFTLQIYDSLQTVLITSSFGVLATSFFSAFPGLIYLFFLLTSSGENFEREDRKLMNDLLLYHKSNKNTSGALHK